MEKFFLVSIMRHWHRSFREAAATPSLEAFKVGWKGQPGLVEASPSHGRRVEGDDL